MEEFDVNKDYYRMLGVPPNCLIDELKTAHVTLALKHHPDMQTEKQKQIAKDKLTTKGGGDSVDFRNISEAWAVLSKPSLRKRYDEARKMAFQSSNIPSSGVPTIVTEIPHSYSVQKENFVRVQHQASSNWKEMKDKYKTEKWQNMPLSEKKSSRARQVNGMGFSILTTVLPSILVICGAYGYWQYQFANRGSQAKRK